MIIDLVSNIKQYKVLGERIAKAIDFITQSDFKSMELGKHIIDGDEIYAIVNEYETKLEANAKPETHKKYIDIQLMVEGIEYMGYTPFTGQESSVPYNPEKDVEFYKLKTDLVEVKSDMFAIFFPQDIHQPGVQFDGPLNIRKVVIKVLV